MHAPHACIHFLQASHLSMHASIDIHRYAAYRVLCAHKCIHACFNCMHALLHACVGAWQPHMPTITVQWRHCIHVLRLYRCYTCVYIYIYGVSHTQANRICSCFRTYIAFIRRVSHAPMYGYIACTRADARAIHYAFLRHKHAYVCSCVRICTHASITQHYIIHIHARMHAYSHGFIHLSQTCMHACMYHTYTCIHRNLHRHACVYIHLYIYIISPPHAA